MAEGKLNDVRAKLRDLRHMERALKAVVADCCATRGQDKLMEMLGP